MKTLKTLYNEAKTNTTVLTLNKKGAAAIAAANFGTDVENFFVMAERLLPIMKRKNSIDLLNNIAANHLIITFEKAFAENPVAALRILFYLRDPRNGQGRKSIFHVILYRTMANMPSILEKILPFIPKYGSWRDLQYLLLHDKARPQVLKFWLNQLEEDMQTLKSNDSVNISLAAKYFPTSNRGKLSQKIFRLCFGNFSDNTANNIQRLQMLSRLKKALALVEQKMTSGEWKGINFQHVSAKALKNYTKAFQLHTPKEFDKFLNDVLDQNVTAHTTGITPVEIVHNVINNEMMQKAGDALWSNMDILLPKNILVMADTSGSMVSVYGLKYKPLEVCLALAMYFSERLPASSPFYKKFLSFATSPKLIEISDNPSLKAKYEKMSKTVWTGSTNVNAAFELLLASAKNAKTEQQDMPQIILIISDMQFDGCVSTINYDTWKQNFRAAGYELPQVIFWNVGTDTKSNPAKAKDNETLLITGQSDNAMKLVCAGNFKNTRELIEEILERYSDIVL